MKRSLLNLTRPGMIAVLAFALAAASLPGSAATTMRTDVTSVAAHGTDDKPKQKSSSSKSSEPKDKPATRPAPKPSPEPKSPPPKAHVDRPSPSPKPTSTPPKTYTPREHVPSGHSSPAPNNKRAPVARTRQPLDVGERDEPDTRDFTPSPETPRDQPPPPPIEPPATAGGERYRVQPFDDRRDYLLLGQEGYASLVVTSDPEGAIVTYNGMVLGRTPVSESGLTPGVGSLSLRLEGYRPWFSNIALSAGQTTQIHATLVRESATNASLRVISDPEGAKVVVNGREYGAAPVDVPDVTPGEVTVVLAKPGFRMVNETITLQPGEHRTLTLQMPLKDAPELPAELTVTSSPGDVEVYLDGTLLGTTPLTMKQLRPGKAVLLGRKEGYANARRTMHLVPGETASAELTLAPLQGSIKVTTTPPGAAITLDGNDAGVSPLTLDKVLAGSHIVGASLENYLDVLQQVTVENKETAEVRLVLEPLGEGGSGGSSHPEDWGQLYVESFPNGAEVYLNYERTYRYTPAYFAQLTPGWYIVGIYQEGEGWDERRVLVLGGKRTQLTLDASRRPALIGGYASGGYGGYGGYDAYDRYGNRPPVGSSWSLDVGPTGRYLMLWDHSFDAEGDEAARDAVVLDDGSTVLAGYQESAGARNGWMVKLDPQGDMVWSRSLNARGWSELTSLAQTSDGGFILAGHSAPDSSSEADAWLMKTDADGLAEWSRTYGGSEWDGANDVLQTRNGSYLFCGETWSEGRGKSDGWLVKVAPDGYVEWSRLFGDEARDRFTAIDTTAAPSIVLVGSTEDISTEQSDAWLVQTTLKGRQTFSRTYGGSENDAISSLAVGPDGSMVLAGYTESDGMLLRNAWLIRLNRNLEEVWSRTYGEQNAEVAWGVAMLPHGGYVLTGITPDESPLGVVDDNAWVIVTDYRGEMTWFREFSGPGIARLHAVKVQRDDSLLFAGQVKTPHNTSDMWAFTLEPETRDADVSGSPISPTSLMLHLIDKVILK